MTHQETTFRYKMLPFLEGLLLAALVFFVLSTGGEVVRASYHGLLHTTLGQAVSSQGFLPENPYHAGAPLRYYTLYPWLGVQLGTWLGGALWGFAALNILAAFLFAPALDALGRALEMSFSARRFAFLAGVLGFHGLGWLALSGDGDLYGSPPVMALREMVLPNTPYAWDARLQAFLPKFLNVSSFAISLPFALSALASALRVKGRPVEVFAPLAFTLALNPLVGGFVSLVIVLWKYHTLLSGTLSQRLLWPLVGLASFFFAGVSLLPLMHPAPGGESLTGGFAFSGPSWANLIGPSFLLLVLSRWGWPHMQKAPRAALLGAIVLAALLAFVPLPWANQYKLARLFALLLALPAGVALGRFWSVGGAFRIVPVSLGLICLPTTVFTTSSYLQWGASTSPLPIQTIDSHFQPSPADLNPFPEDLAHAEANAPSRAVLWLHPNHPGTHAVGSVAQGNALAPLFRHSLFVDKPQIHNDSQPDLRQRLDLSMQFWGDLLKSSESALTQARQLLADRPFLIVTHDSALVTVQALGEDSAAELLATDQGWQMWLLPALE